jgi:hypothetical protein
MTRATLPPEAFGWAREVAEEWIQWVEDAGIDVIGDLDDLRPAAPPEQWHDPDRPRPREMVDAALDVIEVLLREAAATKPEPLVTQTRRLARMARRLRPPS